MIRQRHYCGELLNIDIFISHGEITPAFFDRFDRKGRGEIIETCPKCNELLDLDFCGEPWLIEPMPYLNAETTAREKYCSNCWQYALKLEDAKDMEGNSIGVRVVCTNCLEDTQGYISRVWIDHKRAEDYINYREESQK